MDLIRSLTKPLNITYKFMHKLVEAIDGVNCAISQLPEDFGLIVKAINRMNDDTSIRHTYRFVEATDTDGVNRLINTRRISHITYDDLSFEISMHCGPSWTFPIDRFDEFTHFLIKTDTKD